MNKYNLDKLVKVECNDFYQSRWYTFRKEKRFLGIVTQKQGIYDDTIDHYLGFKVPEYHTLKDYVVYENPEVILRYQAEHSKTYYFNSFDEAKEFGRWQS